MDSPDVSDSPLTKLLMLFIYQYIHLLQVFPQKNLITLRMALLFVFVLGSWLLRNNLHLLLTFGWKCYGS